MKGAHTSTLWLRNEEQRLGFYPALGGCAIAWQWLRRGEAIDLWRPWTGPHPPNDPNATAHYPLVPWSNRIGQGGFTADDVFYPLPANTDSEPCAIHGNGWQQAWSPTRPSRDSLMMSLTSKHHQQSPYHYHATQSFTLITGGMLQVLGVRNLGTKTLPFGLGLHPWFTTTPECTVQASVSGVWESGTDKLPNHWTAKPPPQWDLNFGVQPTKAVIDHCFTGWDGQALLRWPERNVSLHINARLRAAGCAQPLWTVFYSPSSQGVFCFEPVSHPINAPHLPEQPGWMPLPPGKEMQMEIHWRFGAISEG